MSTLYDGQLMECLDPSTSVQLSLGFLQSTVVAGQPVIHPGTAIDVGNVTTSKGAITSKIKHAIKHRVKLRIIAAITSSCNKT